MSGKVADRLGKAFKGVYDRQKKEVELFSDTRKGTATGEVKVVAMNNPEIDWLIGDEAKTTLMEEIELLDGASVEFRESLSIKASSLRCSLVLHLLTSEWKRF